MNTTRLDKYGIVRVSVLLLSGRRNNNNLLMYNNDEKPEHKIEFSVGNFKR